MDAVSYSIGLWEFRYSPRLVDDILCTVQRVWKALYTFLVASSLGNP